jgi:arylsulfatase A-like enzyme
MTGQHTGHTWIRGNFSIQPAAGRIPLRTEDVTVAEVLKAAGYATGITGKWGLGEPDTTGLPNRQGFDFWFGYLNQNHAHSYYPDYLWRNEETKIPTTGINQSRTIKIRVPLTSKAFMDLLMRPMFIEMSPVP